MRFNYTIRLCELLSEYHALVVLGYCDVGLSCVHLYLISIIIVISCRSVVCLFLPGDVNCFAFCAVPSVLGRIHYIEVKVTFLVELSPVRVLDYDILKCELLSCYSVDLCLTVKVFIIDTFRSTVIQIGLGICEYLGKIDTFCTSSLAAILRKIIYSGSKCKVVRIIAAVTK